MTKAAEISEAVQEPLEKYALGHIRKNHYAAREAQDADEFLGSRTFGIAYWENLHRRFMEVLVRRKATPFVQLGIAQGYAVPAIDHQDLGLIGLHHHRVERPDYVPGGDSAGALKDRATREDGLFKQERTKISHRLIGIVGNPFGDLEEVVVGKLEPVYPGDYRLAHKRKLDLERGSGLDRGDDDGGPEVGPDPEPINEPTVKRREKAASS